MANRLNYEQKGFIRAIVNYSHKTMIEKLEEEYKRKILPSSQLT
jgi:hypothetical protein